ncbi:MAG: WG repeat-containing protein [bacterium]
MALTLIGETFLARYQITAKLGDGGFSTVYLANDLELHTEVALKVLHPHLANNPAIIRRFHRELDRASKLVHPNVVRYLDQGEDLGLHFLVQEYLSGKTIEQLIQESGPLPPERAVSILTQVAGALCEAETQGILHRDLKPANIMLLPGDIAKVLDFGIAKDLFSTVSGSSFALTPRYASPEQIAGQRNLDGRSDLFSLGVTLYEMLTGNVPYSGNTPVEILRSQERGYYSQPKLQTDSWLGDVIRNLIAFQKNDRYSSAAELLQVLQSCQEGAVPPRTIRRRPFTKILRRWWPAVAILVVSAVVLTMVLMSLGLSAPPGPTTSSPTPTDSPTQPPPDSSATPSSDSPSPSTSSLTPSPSSDSPSPSTSSLTPSSPSAPANTTNLRPLKFRDGRYGYIDLAGNIVIQPKFQDVGDFYDGLAAAELEDRWGYIDQGGDFRIPNQYLWAGDFSEKLAQVWVVGTAEPYQYIDTNGIPISQETFSEASAFSEGFAAVRQGSEFWYINRNGGNPFGETWTFEIGSFHQGLARVKNADGFYIYIDISGQQAFQKFFKIKPGDFHDGLAYFQDPDSKSWGFINLIGEEFIPAQFISVEDFSEGFAAFQDRSGYWGFIDTTGTKVIDAKYKAVAENGFTENLAAVQEGGKWGYINSSGLLEIPAQFNQSAGPFRNGIALVGHEGNSFYITTSGQKIEVLEAP